MRSLEVGRGWITKFFDEIYFNLTVADIVANILVILFQLEKVSLSFLAEALRKCNTLMHLKVNLILYGSVCAHFLFIFLCCPFFLSLFLSKKFFLFIWRGSPKFIY